MFSVYNTLIDTWPLAIVSWYLLAAYLCPRFSEHYKNEEKGKLFCKNMYAIKNQNQ